MKKVLLTLLMMSCSAVYAGNNLGTEVRSELFGSIYTECISENDEFEMLAKLIKTERTKLCSCVSEQAVVEFDKVNMEQRLNRSDISINQFYQEMEKMGEKAGKHCVEKFYKPKD